MLGNFSFGDYFKREAIAYAWEFVTDRQYLGLHPDRLRVTVHHGDQEARKLWREISGLPDHRIYGLGDQDNFWQMGETGPCGPCSEIYVDLRRTGGRKGGKRGRGEEGSAVKGVEVLSQQDFERLAESGEMLEIWNLVFMQFDRTVDGTLTPLPRPSVDTGAGLERVAAVMQGVDSNFHTDLFMPLIDRVADLVGKPYDRGPDGGSFRVLADHARAVTFLLADGVYPSNEGRGYVLRRILRRGVRHAWLLGQRRPILAPLTDVVVREMGDVYPEIRAKAPYVADVTRQEEERFLETIEGGLKRLEELFASGQKVVPGVEAFRLYDTFGFPIDLTQIIAGERGVGVDLAGFEEALAEQRERSREVHKSTKGIGTGATVAQEGDWTVVSKAEPHFTGYAETESSTELVAFRQADGITEIVLRGNPFYAESGGQVSDTGVLEGEGWSARVEGVRKDPRWDRVLVTRVSAPITGGRVTARVDRQRRRDIERNHSATHLVHWALRKHLGTHVRQQGSLVEPGRLRFDFSHHGPVEPRVLDAIEREVYDQVLENWPVETEELPYAEAIARGAMAFFSEKYGDRVRVVRMGPSLELCGGTHVRSTGQLGLFQFAGQGGVAAGVRRIEAVTGPEAYARVEREEALLMQIAESLKAHPDQVLRRIDQVRQEKEKLEARLAQLAKSGAAAESVGGETRDVRGVAVTIGEAATDSRDEVAVSADRFREGKQRAVLVLFSRAGRGAVHVAVTDDLVREGRKAGDLVNRIAQVSGGKGGGRPGFASAGLGDPDRLGAAREATPALVDAWLSA
jgi:alanyl-tRNA synthetase